MSVYIIAEIGVNHDGNLDKAHKLIDAAADAGVDAVKFQTYRADELAIAGPHRDMLAKYQMPLAWYPELKKHAIDRGVEFGSSAFDIESAKFLRDLGVPWIKVGSGEITNLALLEGLMLLHTPLIISTGMASQEEVDAAVCITFDRLKYLMHCVSCYPADSKSYNLKSLRRLPVPSPYWGLSDHTQDDLCAIASVALGVKAIEKHITLTRFDKGPDHKMSSPSFYFPFFVERIREAEECLGDGIRKPIPGEVTSARRVQTPEGFKRNP